VFVGPPSDVIARMGSKIAARHVMVAAGVPVVPGETPADQSDKALTSAVLRVGLPVLVKASAGGGGKGMRTIHATGEIEEAVQAARREAVAAFGDGTLYVERALDRPRHVEVQVVADHHGHVVHLFERECSVQRRHQKVIEESPSPALTPVLRRRMTEAAVRAARAAGYRNAGTVEFLVEPAQDPDEALFYFLEMNTRLQVEHPVTEAVVGVDLVRAQLMIASGDPLPWAQDSLVQRGHAIEARVYAEDPSRGFLPQAGRVLLYREPGRPGVRIDSGLRENDTVSIHYDPLLAKVIASAETRDLARRRLIAALREFPVLGINTNTPFLVRVLEHPRFVGGTIDTAFLEAESESLAEASPAEMPPFVALAMEAADRAPAVGPSELDSQGAWDPWQRLREWRG
jgi:acetyl/propionyl-CoA carboxylase alpha subunit